MLMKRLRQSMDTIPGENGESVVIEKEVQEGWIAPMNTKNGSTIKDLDGTTVDVKYRVGEDNLPYQKLTERQAQKFALELKMPPPFCVDGLWFCSFILTPAHARWLLNTYCDHNRNLIFNQLSDLGNEVKSSNWFLLHTGLAFANRQLKDGQHRCVTVAESGTAVPILACLNLLKDAPEAMDQHARRSAVALSQIRGDIIPGALAATAKVVLKTNPSLTQEYGSSAAAVVRLVDKRNDDLFAFVEGSMKIPMRGISNADVKGAIVKIYGEVKGNAKLLKRLTHFMEVLKTGIVSGPGDSAAIKLRDKLVQQSQKRLTNTEKYLLTLKAIRFFLDETSTERLFLTKMDIESHKASLAKTLENRTASE